MTTLLRLLLSMSFAPALLATPIAASAATTPAPVEDAHRTKALQLARLVFSIDSMAEGMGRIMEAKAKQAFSSDPEMQRQERAHPGLGAAVAERVRVVITDGTRASVPVLWERLADIYAARLNDSQLEESAAFYNGPVGRQMLALLIGEAQNRDPRNLEQQAASEAHGEALPSPLAGLSPEQLEALRRFSQSSAGAALLATEDEAQLVRGRWSSETAAALRPRAEEAMISAAEAFIAPHPAAAHSARQR